MRVKPLPDYAVPYNPDSDWNRMLYSVYMMPVSLASGKKVNRLDFAMLQMAALRETYFAPYSKVDYQKYLQSEKWKQMRNIYLGLYKATKKMSYCHDCLLNDSKNHYNRWGLHLHHLHYNTLCNEEFGDLILICERHHRERHVADATLDYQEELKRPGATRYDIAKAMVRVMKFANTSIEAAMKVLDAKLSYGEDLTRSMLLQMMKDQGLRDW